MRARDLFMLGALLPWSVAAGPVEVPGKDRRVVEVAIPVEAQPFDLVFSPDGKTAYVSHVHPGKISEIRENRVKRTVQVGRTPTGMAMSRDGKTLYVGLMDANTLAVLDVPALSVRKKIQLPGAPIGVTLPSHERYVVVTCRTSGSLALVSTSTWEMKIVPVGNMPYFSAMTPDDKRIYTANHGGQDVSVTIVETDKGPLKADNIHTTPLKRVKVGSGPVGLAIGKDGKLVYVANYHAGTVSVLSYDGNRVEKTLQVGKWPYWVALHPEGGYLMISNYGSNHVDVIYKDHKHTRVETRQSLVKLFFSPGGRRVFTTNFVEGRVGVIE